MLSVSVSKSVERLLRFFFFFLWEGVNEGDEAHLVKWEVVSMPVEVRGLGIGNPRLCNETLLAWLWCFFLEPNVMWYRVIVSKYGPHTFE